VSGHWTDDQLIDSLYGIGPEDNHAQMCAECQGRLAVLQANRQAVESGGHEDVSFEFLAAQRREIYAKITAPQSWWSNLLSRRWTSAAATAVALTAGVFVYQQKHQQIMHNEVSDAQLAREVSCMGQDLEPHPTAPLQALFEE
jgi:anti-sigma-K factor RskA